ncbi:AAA domain-containing protein [Streptomyces sp. NPDC046909]|uniref:caspase, EACC1-associated type n=1 Tax=Streptomyces sp. NPDC046909 TaxID=3155617 RepID=UPI0033DC4858
MTRLVRRRALLIGNEHYDDGRFPPLPSTQADTWGMEQVLQHRNIGGFVSVTSRDNLAADDMREVISEFLEACEQDELALVYVSGHGARLVRDGGEFYFIATDTDFDRITETAVSAGFVNEQLEQCWASQKVMMIDCCRSGGFAVGLRTSDRQSASVAKSAEQPLLTSRGTYVLSSSRAGEDSYADVASTAEVRPSDFTAEVIEALRTGKVSKDGKGDVSVEDLFHHVNRRMRAQGARQVPVKSAFGVDDRIVLADCPLGAAPLLVPLTRRPVSSPGQAEQTSPRKSAQSQPSWPRLLDYYRECVLSDETDTPLMSVGDRDSSYVCLSGSERLLSGDVDDDGCIPVPAEASPLIESATEQEAELWAGYPAVVVTGPRGGRPWRHPKFAPLLIRRVEIVSEGGQVRLKPYGPVQPHPQLARDWLGEEEAAQLADTFQPTWHRGQHDRMAVEAGKLLMEEFELPCVQELHPDQLADRIDTHTPSHGARNTAVLFAALPDTAYTKKLLDDFADIAGKPERIQATALAALSPDVAERTRALAAPEPEPPRLVTPLPCNEAQAAVLRSAMTRRLTVATGPPGTGKSQLVANLVATAITSGQSVLVASNNNEAVDEVWRRCENLVPGSVIRTGSARAKSGNYVETEAKGLDTLRTAPEPVPNVTTAAMNVDIALSHLNQVRQGLAHIAKSEKDQLQAGGLREQHAEQLALSVSELTEKLPQTERLDQLEARARRLAHARFLGSWRRTRFLRKIGLARFDGDRAEGCLSLAGFAAAHASWHSGYAQVAEVDDAALATTLDTAEADVQNTSHALLQSAVRTNARAGRQRILNLLSARDSDRTDWPAIREVLPAAPGWAVTSLSARRFPPGPALFDLVVIDEASQCAIPHVLPLLFRAKRALVIGDAMQLPHIANIGPEREVLIRRNNGLRSAWLEKHRLAYRRHSAFHAAERAAGGTLLLDEHFRCHPDIAAVSNELFYEQGLTVLTDTRGRPSLPRRSIFWSHVPGRATRPPHGSSWVNYDEIRQVHSFVHTLLEQLPEDATIGVVTPFKPQADELRDKLRQYDQQRVRVGTVHTFQGGERDVMVFSLVAGEGMHAAAIGWVHRQLNLWNVAITRARSHLIVVGDMNLWRERGGVAAELLNAATTNGPRTDDRETGDLVRRLYQTMSAQPGTTVALGESINGHPVDVLVQPPDAADPHAVLLDSGPDDGADEARHLRLMLRRRELLDSAEQGGQARRYPAWRLYDTSTG